MKSRFSVRAEKYPLRRHCAQWRVPARRLALVELKARGCSYPMLGECVLDPRCDRRRTGRAERGNRVVFGAAADSTLLGAARSQARRSRHLAALRSRFEASSTREPDNSAAARSGPPVPGQRSRLRATNCWQPAAWCAGLPGQAAGQRGRDRAAAAPPTDARSLHCLRQAGRFAAATTPRPSLNVPSTASPSFSLWVASPRSWSAE